MFVCSEGHCDFASGPDGIDLFALALPFFPGTPVEYQNLPHGYVWADGDKNQNENCGRGNVCDLIFLKNAEGKPCVFALVLRIFVQKKMSKPTFRFRVSDLKF